MKRAMLGAALVLSPSFAVFGQPPANAPAFEVATVKPSKAGNNTMGGSGGCSRGRLSLRNYPLSLIIEQAYRVREFQLHGRPSWLTSERFDIEARTESSVGNEQCNLMMQALLADRFKLALHRETKQLPVYRLLVGKNGPKLRKVDANAPSRMETFNTNTGKLIASAASMKQLAGMLAMTGELENLVLDETALEGNYAFTLEWIPSALAGDGTLGPFLTTALQEQLGLKLEAGKGPVEVLVIDRVERVPSEN